MPFSSELGSRSAQRFHDSGVMCKLLQITSYNHYHHNLHGKYQHRTQEQLSTLRLATIHSARKEQNFRLAYKLLAVHLSAVCMEEVTEIKLPLGEANIYGEALCKSLCEALKGLKDPKVQSTTRSRIYRESAKLLQALGYSTAAAGVLCDSILHCGNVVDGTTNVGNFSARSLCTLANWILGDKKLLSSYGKGDVNQLRENLMKLMNSCDLVNTEKTGLEDAKRCLDDVDKLCGRLLSLSTQYAPLLDKAWFALGGWAYKMGRKAVEQTRYEIMFSFAVG